MNFFERIFNRSKVSIELDDIQSIILRSRPIPYFGTIAALKVTSGKQGRALLKEILPMVTSSLNWHKETEASVSITLTYEGLKALGVPQESLDSFPPAFREGMAARKDKLRDYGSNDPQNWEKPFGTNQIHVAAAVIADSEEKWRRAFQELEKILAATGGTDVLFKHDFSATEEVKNVFGFRDGISNPEVEGSGVEMPPGYDRPIRTGEFILGYAGESGVVQPFPQPEVLGKNGSFMFVRKYQSHVAEFNKFIKDNSDSPESGELLAAKMIGRWRSGAPLVLSPEQDDEKLGADAARNNDFSYKSDEYGKKCPFGSHIRRLNPRDSKDFILADVRLHRIIRKPLAFGSIVPPEIIEDDGQERGQFFVGISAKAMDTLEFLQGQWINDGNFANLGEEKDPMVGLNEGEGVFTVPQEPLRKRYHGLQTFNTLEGGEYCFIPSISALKWISDL